MDLDKYNLNMCRLERGRRTIQQYAPFDVVLVDAIADLHPEELYVLIGSILEKYDIKMPELRELLRMIRREEELDS
jgi:hypothetical protein